MEKCDKSCRKSATEVILFANSIDLYLLSMIECWQFLMFETWRNVIGNVLEAIIGNVVSTSKVFYKRDVMIRFTYIFKLDSKLL